MSIKIEVEKVVVRGEQKMVVRKITGVLGQHELPVAYISGRHDEIYVWGECEPTRLLGAGLSQPIQAGSYISMEEIEYIRKAGQRLAEVKKKLAEQNKDWKGVETFLI